MERHFLCSYACIVSADSTLAFQARGDGSNPFTCSIFLLSSEVERLAVNQDVAGSNPAVGAERV